MTIYIFFFHISSRCFKEVMINKLKLIYMGIFLLLSTIILVIFFIVKTFFYSAKRYLLKDQAAWSGKEIKINYNKSNEVSESKKNNNYLKMIVEESKIYLDAQSQKEERDEST